MLYIFLLKINHNFVKKKKMTVSSKYFTRKLQLSNNP